MLNKKQMLSKLDTLIAHSLALRHQFWKDKVPMSGDFAAWFQESKTTIETIYGPDSEQLRAFNSIYFSPPPEEMFSLQADLWFDSGLDNAHNTLVLYRYYLDRSLPDTSLRRNTYVFVSHGGPTRTHVDSVRDLLAVLGLYPVIVMDMPNLGLSINEKVQRYMRMCELAIALATEEDEATAAAEKRPRPNVEHEIGMLQASSNIGNRIIYLKEPNVKFASNYQEKVWIPFTKERVQDAFIPLLKEVRAFMTRGVG